LKPTYRHKYHKLCDTRDKDRLCETALTSTCIELGCDERKLLPWARLGVAGEAEPRKPVIHYGPIASGDTVMKSGGHHNEIANEEGIIAFEMEGAGVWDEFGCVVIKGVWDYADSHRKKEWQDYAAATAVACTKVCLEEWVLSGK
jgi:nucleoside phosphorylase